ncbi:hypothetical protein FJT64_012092 [Amphibalanus amphitrite]|uniref:Uncharacterized protein n=1 Tax=Amphibalanus amphitrite TaxID=1232801 RepID=A0A6A4V0G7_AMPAM|nr:hypothetical protein FJT64_012092 [Amphibalanus amphitrite]
MLTATVGSAAVTSAAGAATGGAGRSVRAAVMCRTRLPGVSPAAGRDRWSVAGRGTRPAAVVTVTAGGWAAAGRIVRAVTADSRARCLVATTDIAAVSAAAVRPPTSMGVTSQTGPPGDSVAAAAAAAHSCLR